MAKVHPNTKQFILDILERPERVVDFAGCKLKMVPGVFPVDSEFSFSTSLTVKKIPADAGSVLDVGTGSGVQGIVAAKRGAARVLAIDIDEPSLRCARENVTRNGVERVVEVRESDLFSNIGPEEKFDIMISQLPFADVDYDTPVKDFLFDPGFKLHDRFLKDARDHLNENGTILIPSGDIANEKELLRLIDLYGYSVESVYEEFVNGLTWKVYTLKHLDSPKPLKHIQ